MEKHAVYFQRSKAVHEEFKLIEAATEREVVIGKLVKIIREVKERRKELVDEVILETFRLINEAREVTIKLIKAIQSWQDSFTRPIRPTIYNCDYIVDKMIKHIDFVNGSNIRKLFNFQFLRGNPLLLPYPGLSSSDPIKVHAALGKEIRAFAYPDEESVTECYQFFINCLPEDIYQDHLVSMQKWLIDPWIPRIWVTNNPAPCFPSSRAIAAAKLAKEFPRKPSISAGTSVANSNEGSSASGVHGVLRRGSASSASSASSSNWKHVSVGLVPEAITSVPQRKRMGAVPLEETAATKEHAADLPPSLVPPPIDTSPISRNASKSPKTVTPSVRVQRRNMMKAKEQRQVRAIITDGEYVSEDDSSKAASESGPPALSETQQAEVAQLESYYQELEGMFLPKLGRRAVQTILVGGERKDIDREKEFTYRTHRAFSLFASHAVEKRIQEATEQVVRTEDFKRTNAQLIAKRNRILVERGGGDAEYKDRGNTNQQTSQRGIPRLQAASRGGSATSLVSIHEHSYDDEDSEAIDGESNASDSDVASALMMRLPNHPQPPPGIRTPIQRGDSRRMSDLTVTFHEQPDGVVQLLRHGGTPISGNRPRSSSNNSSERDLVRDSSPARSPPPNAPNGDKSGAVPVSTSRSSNSKRNVIQSIQRARSGSNEVFSEVSSHDDASPKTDRRGSPSNAVRSSLYSTTSNVHGSHSSKQKGGSSLKPASPVSSPLRLSTQALRDAYQREAAREQELQRQRMLTMSR